MSEQFLKFKKRLRAICLIRALLVGLSAGMAVGGGMLLLWKTAVLEFDPIISLIAGLIALAAAGGITYLLGRKSNKALAGELDAKFNLKARVQTMIAYGGEEGDMIALQREDADRALSKIRVKEYKFKGLWIYIIVLVLSAALLIAGFVVKNVRNIPPTEQVTPFELSAVQESAMKEIIRNVTNSELEEEFKAPMVAELEALLASLRNIKTEPEMKKAVSDSMAVICSITYASSTATEVLDGLWNTQDTYLRYLAEVLDTSSWSTPNWQDFAEKLNAYSAVLTGDDKREEGGETASALESLKWSLESMSLNIDYALKNSGVGEDDELRTAINRLFIRNPGGFNRLLAVIDTKNEQEAREALSECLDLCKDELFAAISLNKVNANVGEYAMTRLSVLFSVGRPEFERPGFVKRGESADDGSQGSDEENNEQKPGDGGIGGGASYGSDDLVLDPLTGEYVKLGVLIDKYNTIMNERLNSDFYTEEQKTAIKKYFELLYSGIKKEEGN